MNYFHPDRMPALPAPRRAAARRQLEEMVADSVRSRRRRRPVLFAAAAAVIVVISAAAAVITSRPVTNKTTARCYSVANQSAGHAYYTTITEAGKPRSKAQVRSAHNGCAALFRVGVLRVGRPVIAHSRRHMYRVPRLVVCVRADGTAAVFPGPPRTCADLGLPRAAARRLSGSRRLRPGAVAPVP